MDATERLSQFIVNTRWEDIPEKVVASAKKAIMDTIGVALGGVAEPVGRGITGYVREEGGPQQATVLGGSLRTSVSYAALANGTLAHALDFDDSNWLLNGHASVGVLPAILAQGEVQGSSGKDVIESFVIGFEISSKLGAGMNMALYNNGWHPTCVLGVMGAASALSHLRGFDVPTTQTALGCAASLASGIRANFGTMMKPVHAGLAAEAGVRATNLAKFDISANKGVLTAPSGYCEAFSGKNQFEMEKTTDHLGQPFVLESPGNNLKPYPCCMSAHVPIDAMRSIIEEERIAAGDVEKIEVELLEPSYLNLSHHHPKTGLEGKFSVEYILSRVLTDGVLRLDTFSDEAVNDPDVQPLMARIEARLVEESEWRPGRSRPATVIVHTKDGRTLRRREDRSRGNAEKPLTQQEVENKFRDCAGGSLSHDAIGDVIGAINDLENQPDIRTLMQKLS